MKRKSKIVIALVTVLLLVLSTACAPAPAEITPAPTPEPTPAPEPTPSPGPEGNFRLLISDDVNAIRSFTSLNITISSVGVQKGGESGKWYEFPPAQEELDLVPLQGENATEIWSGNLTDGRYTKVFIYVSDIDAVLNTGNSTDVKLPSEKLHINTHFNIPEDSPVSFVFDITVVAAGNQQSGIKYILKPVVSQSGHKQKFNEVEINEAEDEEVEGEELEFEGIIKTIDGTTWMMTIDDETRTVDVSGAEIEGEAEEGLEAEVEGILVDDTIIASEVEIKEAEEEEEAESEDTTPPEITVTGVTSGQQYSGPVTPVISVSDDTDPEPTLTITLNREPFTSGTEISEVGEYELEVTAVDTSDNEAEVVVNFEIVQE